MKEDLKTKKPGMGRKPFAVLAICILFGLTIAYPYVLHDWFYAIAYPVLREGASWPLVLAALVWFIPLFAFEYWALGKYWRMKKTRVEREQLRPLGRSERD